VGLLYQKPATAEYDKVYSLKEEVVRASGLAYFDEQGTGRFCRKISPLVLDPPSDDVRVITGLMMLYINRYGKRFDEVRGKISA
jgi:hypothetical protein